MRIDLVANRPCNAGIDFLAVFVLRERSEHLQRLCDFTSNSGTARAT
jgi:hypothetical protein